MKAAVLHEFGKIPKYEEFPDPVPTESEVLVQMKAAALNWATKMSTGSPQFGVFHQLPSVIGIDGVGVLEDGQRVYCGFSRPPYGTMGQLTVVPKAWGIPYPQGIDDLTAAALPNAALSSWLSLAYKAQLKRGETVLILGATGVSGKVAVQVAKYLEAGHMVAAGRNESVLRSLMDLGADSTISLGLPDSELIDAFTSEASKHMFDVVLDYIWGHPAEVFISSLLRRNVRISGGARIRFVSIGSIAGPAASIPSAVLRGSGLEIYGSGLGTISREALTETFPKLWQAAARGKIRIDVEPVPLADVQEVWNRPESNGRRFVFVI